MTALSLKDGAITTSTAPVIPVSGFLLLRSYRAFLKEGKLKEKERTRTMAGYLDQFEDAEAFVRRRITANLGSDNVIMKDDLIKLAEERGIKLDKNMTKDQIYLELRKHVSIDEILALCECIGVSSRDIQDRFGIDHKSVKKLEKSGFLKVSGKMRFRMYGKNMYAPLYDPFQIFSLSTEEVQAELEKLGKKKTEQPLV